MSDIQVVAGFQVIIILLLCEPQRRRRSALLAIAVICVGGFAVFHLAPAALEFLNGASKPVVRRIGLPGTIFLFALAAYLIALIRAFWSDRKDNRAIRAGSQEVFDKRVAALMGSSKYTREEAVAAATRVKDGK